MCHRITKISLTRAGRRKSSGGASVGDWETVWSEIRIRCFLTHMDGQIPGRDFLTEQYMFVCWISTMTVFIHQVTEAPQWSGGLLGRGELCGQRIGNCHCRSITSFAFVFVPCHP